MVLKNLATKLTEEESKNENIEENDTLDRHFINELDDPSQPQSLDEIEVNVDKYVLVYEPSLTEEDEEENKPKLSREERIKIQKEKRKELEESKKKSLMKFQFIKELKDVIEHKFTKTNE